MWVPVDDAAAVADAIGKFAPASAPELGDAGCHAAPNDRAGRG